MLPIRQILNALPTSALNRTPKAVLIEVCRLAECDAQGWCTAKNEYLIACLGGTGRTMSRTLTLLEARGLLQSQGQGKARRLAPTATLRACYAGADEAIRHAALVALNLDKSGLQPRQTESDNLDISGPNLDTLAPNLDTNLDKTGPEPRQNDEVAADQPRQKWSPNLDKSGLQPRQNGSRVIGDQFNQDSTSTPPTPEEWAGAQKKIADLERENAFLQAELLRLVPPVAEPPHREPVETQGPQHSEASKALATEMAKVWSLTPMPRHGGDWGLLHRFTHHHEQTGRLAEVRKQFTAYARYRQKRDIEPLGLAKFLGSEAGGFEGQWCQVDWPTKAQQARANGEGLALAAPVTRAAANNKFQH